MLRKWRAPGTLDLYMGIRFTFRHIDGTEALEAYIEKKFAKVSALAKRFHESPSCFISMQRVTGHREGTVFEITVTIQLGPITLVNTEQASDMYAAIDKMESELVRQLEKRMDKPASQRKAGAREAKHQLQEGSEEA